MKNKVGGNSVKELKEFLKSLLPEEILEAFSKKFFERERISAEVRTFGTYMYLGGLSYRKV